MTLDLTGMVAVVTGGARGLGATTAAMLAERGVKVIVADLDDIDESECVLPMDKIHRRLHLDVRDAQSWRELVETVRREEGALDILHLNAGVTSTPRGAVGVTSNPPLTYFAESLFNKVMDVNVRGVFNGILASLPLLEECRSTVVITGSIAGVRGYAPDPIYSMSKHAIVGLTRALGPTFAEKGMKIVAVCPGTMETGLVPAGSHTRLREQSQIVSTTHVAAQICKAIDFAASGDVWLAFSDGTTKKHSVVL